MITKSISTEFYEELAKLIRNEIRNLEASMEVAQRRDDCIEQDYYARRAASASVTSLFTEIAFIEEMFVNSN